MAYTSVKISANSSDYQSQMKSAAAQMKVLSAEYTTAATKAKLFGSETDSLKAKAESLTQKITVQKGIVQLNSEQQEKLTKKLSEQKTKQEELKGKIDAAKEAYAKSTEETGKNSEQSKALKEELDKLEQEYKANETAIGKTETALANQTVKTEKSKTALMNMEAELKNVNEQLKDNKLEKFATACDTAGTKMESFGKKMSVVSAGIAGIGAASIAAFKELDEGYDTILSDVRWFIRRNTHPFSCRTDAHVQYKRIDRNYKSKSERQRLEHRLMEQKKLVGLYAQDYVKDRQFTDCIRTGSDIRICERRITELRASCNRNTQGQRTVFRI